VQVAILGATASGPLLQNGAPGYVPTFAHFTVNGPVITGPGEDTVIQSLTFNNGGSLQVNDSLSVTSGDFSVPSGKASISGGKVIVPREFHKLGGGALVANADFQVAGNSFIQSGALHVNGTFHTPLLHVQPNGTLKGNGLIVGNVLNAGTVAPGNSIGTLSIRGDYTQSHQGALEIEVGGANHYDVLVVSGTARLGGTLEMQDAGHDFEYGDQFTFLHAGRITGEFNRILMPDADRLRGRFYTVGGTGILLVAPTSYTLVAQTANQARVARALDQWIGIENGEIGEVTLGLDLLREEQYPAAFESIMPGRYAAAVELSNELTHSQLQGLHQQFSSRRLERRAWRTQYSENNAAASILSAKGAKQVIPVREPIASAEPESWRAWTQASGLFSQNSWGTTPDDDFESGGFMAGADLRVSELLSVGLFAGYQFGEGDYPGRNDLELEKYSFGGYVTLDVDRFYAHAVVGGGTSEYEVSRAIVLPTLSRAAHSDPDGHEFFASFGTGYDFEYGNFTFGPSVSVQYSRQSLDGVTERGADSLDLALADASVDSLRTYLGARAAYAISLGESSALIPEVRAFWQHEFLQDGETFHAALDGGAGPGFDYVTEDPERDALFAGAGLNLLVGSHFSTSVFYHAEFGRTDDVNHTVSVNASWKF
jgi:outer membrane autotransporter protein